MLSTLVDITDRKQAEEALNIAHDLSLALGSTDDITHALDLILDAALRMEGVDCGGIFVSDQEGALDLTAYRGLTAELIATVTHYSPDTFVARIARESGTVHGLLENLPTGADEVYAKEGVRAIVVIPVRHQDQLLVLLALGSHTHDTIPVSTRHALETLGQQVGAILMRLRVAAALHESRQNLQTMFHTVDDFLFVLDDAGHIKEANAATLRRLGYSRGELLNLDIFALHPPDRRTEAEALMADMLAGRCEFSPLPLQTKEGTPIPVETHVTPGTWGGNPAIFGLCRDVTDRLRVEEEKRAVERQMFHTQKLESLGVLAGGIAHDFNNLLMAILCNIDMALQDIPPSGSAQEFLAEALKSTQRAAALTRQMLAYSGRGHFIVTPVDLADVVRQMAPLLNVSIRKNITLKIETADSLPLIAADMSQLQQVVMNLVINAAEAYVDSGSGAISVLVDVRYCTEEFLSQAPSDVLAGCKGSIRAGEYVYLTVTDHGSGMSEETKNHLFDPFFTTKFTGRGLGLAAVLGIIRGHRAAIHVDSLLGEGATFSVFFPVTQQVETQGSEEEPPPPNVPLRNTAAILAVDDEPAVLKAVVSLLKRHGYSVISAANGLEALSLYTEHMGRIDCVLLDLNMPDMDGEAVFQELRKKDPNVRVILASGYDEEETARRFAGLGITGFLQKPYLPRVLTDKIQAVLASAG